MEIPHGMEPILPDFSGCKITSLPPSEPQPTIPLAIAIDWIVMAIEDENINSAVKMLHDIKNHLCPPLELPEEEC